MIQFLVLSLLLIFSGLHAEHKTAKEVFHKWFQYQTVYKDRPLVELNKNIGPSYWNNFCEMYKESKKELKGYRAFFQTAFDPNVLATGDHVSHRAAATLKSMRKWLDKSPGKFLTYLQNSNVLNEVVNEQEQHAPINDVIDKNKTFLRMLLNHSDERTCDEYQFACANRLFEYCFAPETFGQFFKMLNDQSRDQINRFCYSTLWYNLVGDGWKHWHEDCLHALAKRVKHGDEIVYIAGGNDIHEPLRYGVYTMRIIDPMLPSQDEYYAENVGWLLSGDGENHGLGDTFDVQGKDKALVITRSDYQENGTFKAPLSTGKTVTLPQSTTTWTVADKDSGKHLGRIIFERRYAAQRDFDKHPKKVLLASYNELYFVGAQPRLGGWGMNVAQFDKNLMVYVKQLRKPLTKEVMQNLYKTDEVDFSFISLGSCPT